MPQNNLGSHDYIQTLKGQTLRFPNLDGLVRDWPHGFNPHYDVLKQVHNAELNKLLGPTKRYAALVAADCAHNAATWWPTSNFHALRLAANFVAFLYVWDNEIDSPEFSDLQANWDAAEKFREDTIKHVEAYLGVAGLPDSGIRAEDVPMAIASFNPVGEASACRLTRGQKSLFLAEIIRYIRATGGEQSSELSRKAPTIEEYLPLRMGTSGVAAMAALIEYMMGVDLGDALRDDPDVQKIYEETNCIISLMNDMFSLRRELMFPFYNNAVAVLYHQHQNLQVAVDETYKIIAKSVASLDAAAESVLLRYPGRKTDLEAFVKGAKTMCTGNMTWSKHVPRYNLGITKFDGTTEITI